jgi:chemotaxis response regulator CheB
VLPADAAVALDAEGALQAVRRQSFAAIVLAQVIGMPGAALAAGLADRTVELSALAAHVTNLTNGNGGTT